MYTQKSTGDGVAIGKMRIRFLYRTELTATILENGFISARVTR